MNPLWEDSEIDVITTQRLQAQKLEGISDDVDALATAQREAVKHLTDMIESAVRGIGQRIEGFDAACAKKVDSVHDDVTALRADIREKDAKREWTRPEKLTSMGLTLTFVVSLLGLALR